jgi:hypothetical protein
MIAAPVGFVLSCCRSSRKAQRCSTPPRVVRGDGFDRGGLFAGLFGLLAIFLCPASAWAVPSYVGIYIVSNPYQSNNANTLTLYDLSQAAATPCNGTQSSSSEFCGISYTVNQTSGSGPVANGIFLTIPWCGWELDGGSVSCSHEVNTMGVGPGNGTGSPPPLISNVSPCAPSGSYTFDNCGAYSPGVCPLSQSAPASWSVIMTALYDVCQIDKRRASNLGGPLPPLRLSFSLVAGLFTPVSVQNGIPYNGARGTIDLPFSTAVSTMFYCGRVPQVYAPNYTADYNTAFTALLSFLVTESHFTNGPTIPIVKLGGLNSDTAEMVFSGNALQPGALVQDLIMFTPETGAPEIDCSYLNNENHFGPASEWQTVFGSSGARLTLAQAVENASGTILGDEYTALSQQSAAQPTVVPADFLISIATRNGQAFPDLNCGQNNAPLHGNCMVDNPYETGDSWSAYYLAEFVQQLFNGGGAGAAALAAAPTYFPNFTPQQLSLDATNLQPPPTGPVNMQGPIPGNAPLAYPGSANVYSVSYGCTAISSSCPALAKSELPCLLNNTTAANDGSLQLKNLGGNDTDVSINGVGTVIGWQTDPSDTQYCGATQSPTYSEALQFGVANGGEFIEVSVGEAGNTKCQPVLAYSLSQMLNSPQTNCLYN